MVSKFICLAWTIPRTRAEDWKPLSCKACRSSRRMRASSAWRCCSLSNLMSAPRMSDINASFSVAKRFWNKKCANVVKRLIGTLRSNDATSARTSLKKWICVPSVFIAIIPTHLLCQLYANPPGIEILGPISKFRKRNKISSLLVYVLYKT